MRDLGRADAGRQRPEAANRDSTYGLGMQLLHRDGRLLAGHTGSMPGFLATGERLRVVRDAAGVVSHLDLGTVVFTRQPYDPAAPVPVLFAQWVGPDAMATRIEHWDASTGGSWRYVSVRDGTEYGFRGCFHDVRPDRIVQTFTFDGDPDGVVLITLWFEDLGDGRTRLRTQSLVDSFEGRDAWLRTDMKVGVDEGYAKLDRMVFDGAV